MTDLNAYKRKPNGLAEDLGAVIGFSNTLLLCGTRGGKNIYVPEQVTPDHWLASQIGPQAFKAIVAEWGGETITVPGLADFGRYQRIRRCAELLCAGRSLHAIARATGVTYNQAKNDRRRAELLGLLPLVFHGKSQVMSDAQVIEQLGFEGF